MRKPSGFDFGLAVVAAVLIAIAAAIVWLVARATADPAAAVPQREAPLDADLARRLEEAERELEQARQQRLQDPIGGFDAIVGEKQREVARLRRELGERDR